MAISDELSEQLATTQKLAAVVEQMSRSFTRIESSFDNQIAAVEKLTAAIQTLKSHDLGSLNNTKLDGLRKELKNTTSGTTALTGRIKDLSNTIVKKFPTSVAIGVAALSGFVQGVRNVLALGKGIAGFFASFVDGAVSIAAALVAIPFKMFNALLDMAAQAGAGMNELMQAIENLRKEMGDLKGPGTSAVLEVTKTLKGFSDTGLGVWRVFGTIAERLELVTKLAVAMGATFGLLTKEFRENSGALLAFQKALGVSEEGMKSIGDRAIIMGKPMTKIFMDMTKQTLALGKAFDIDQKLIGKDMTKAMIDVKHFGALTVKEIAQASVYSRKLGIELDKIVGTLDAFETFDDAAENAAKLSQAFGVTIDAFQMMEAQNPAEQIDMLRKAFRLAGVDSDKFTRQQTKLLAQSTALDDVTVRQAFSAKNYGVSLDNVKKQSEAAEKKTLTQAEAMGKLADSIERMVKSGETQEGSFWKMFVKGFFGGIQASKEFRDIIWNIKRSLQLVYFEGVKLGRAFVDMFPGVKQFLGSIAEFFRPTKFKQLTAGTVDVIKSWMINLSKPGGQASFPDLMKNLQKHFFDFFDVQSESGKHVLNGFKTIFKTITTIASEAIKWASDRVGEGLTIIIDLISGKKKLDMLAKAGGGLGFLAEVIAPLIGALAHSWDVIAPKLHELVQILGQKLYAYLTSDDFLKLVKPAIPFFAAMMFGPAFTRALLAAATTSLGKAAIGLFTKASTKKVIEDVALKASSEVTSAAQNISANVSNAGAGMQQVGAVNKAAAEAINPPGTKSWGVQDAIKLGAKLVAIAAALATGGIMMAYAITHMRSTLKNGGVEKPEDVAATLAVLGAMVVASIPLMFALKLAKVVGSPADIIIGGTIVSIAVGLVGSVGALLTWMLSKAGTPEQLKSAGDMMLKMSTVFLMMVPLLVASAAIGAFVIVGGPLVLAAAGTGMVAITAAVTAMVDVSMGIVKKLTTLSIGADFQRKIDAFLGVMKAIQSFTDTLVKLIGFMTPSLTELLSGTASKFSEKVDSSVKLIDKIVGKKGSGYGIIGIVESVILAMKDITTHNISESAKVFSGVLTDVTSAIQAMTPPPEFYSAQTDFMNVLDPSIGKSLDQTMNGYMQVMQAQVTTLIAQVVETIGKFSTISLPDEGKARVVGSLISGVTGLMKAIMPDPDAVKAFSSIFEKNDLFSKTKLQSIDVDKMTTFMSTYALKLKDLIPMLTGGIITDITGAVQNISIDKLSKISVLGDIMKVIVDMVKVFGDVGKMTSHENIELDQGKIKSIEKTITQSADIPSLMNNVIANIGPFIESMKNIVGKIPMNVAFTKNLETMKTLFGFLGEIPRFILSMSDASKATGGDINNTDALVAGISSISLFFGRLVGGAAFGTSKAPLVELLDNVGTIGSLLGSSGAKLKALGVLQGFFETLPKIMFNMRLMIDSSKSAGDTGNVSVIVEKLSKDVTSIKEPIKKIIECLNNEMLDSVKGAGARIGEFSKGMEGINDSIINHGVKQSLAAVGEMIKKTQELDDALAKAPNLDVNARLTKLATGMGIGGKFAYSVKSKDVVVNLNLNVSMNVDEVEKVMIMRKSSIIRDRINWATGPSTAGESGSPEIPETYTSVLPKITK